MEVGHSVIQITSENDLHAKNSQKDEALNKEFEETLEIGHFDQETTAVTESHTHCEEKVQNVLKNEEKPTTLSPKSQPKKDHNAPIIIEDIDTDDDVQMNSTSTFEDMLKITGSVDLRNSKIIKSKKKQIGAKSTRNSKKSKESSKSFGDPSSNSSLSVMDPVLQERNLYSQPRLLPYITATPQQLMSSYIYSQQIMSQIYNQLNLPQMLSLNGNYEIVSWANNAIQLNNQLRNLGNEIVIIDDTPIPGIIKKPEQEPVKKPEKSENTSKKSSKSRIKKKQIRKSAEKSKENDQASEESMTPEPQKQEKSLEDSKDTKAPLETIRKKRKFNRDGVVKPARSETIRVYEDYTFNIHFEDKEKEGIVETSIGYNYQAEIPPFELDQTPKAGRKVKIVWNPEEFSKKKIKDYFTMLKDNVECNGIHQERALKLFKKFDMDSSKLLEHIKKNPLYYKNYFEVRSYQSILRQRNTSH